MCSTQAFVHSHGQQLMVNLIYSLSAKEMEYAGQEGRPADHASVGAYGDMARWLPLPALELVTASTQRGNNVINDIIDGHTASSTAAVYDVVCISRHTR